MTPTFMLAKDISFYSPQENILFDEVLLDLAEKNPGTNFLRFWESPQMFIVLGRISKVEDDLNIEQIKSDCIPVLRRSSGGGTVLQGPGCLNYSLILSKSFHANVSDIKKSYEFILSQVVRVFDRLEVHTIFHPISDIALVAGEKKFSGNAQKRGRHCILHHGTILYNFDLGQIEKYLLFPKSVPEYRDNRRHLDFVTNVVLKVSDIKKEFYKEFKVSDIDSTVNALEKEQLVSLVKTKNVIVEV